MCLLPASSLYRSASGHHEPIVEILDTNTFLEARSQSYVCHEKPMAILTVGAQNKTASCSSHEGVNSTNHTYNTHSPCCMLKFNEAQLNQMMDRSCFAIIQPIIFFDCANELTQRCFEPSNIYLSICYSTIVASYGDAILLRRFSSIYTNDVNPIHASSDPALANDCSDLSGTTHENSSHLCNGRFMISCMPPPNNISIQYFSSITIKKHSRQTIVQA